MTFPARLQRCADAMKEDFYDSLREIYYAKLCHRILEIAAHARPAARRHKQRRSPEGSQ